MRDRNASAGQAEDDGVGVAITLQAHRELASGLETITEAGDPLWHLF
jgi:hypothetical protein